MYSSKKAAIKNEGTEHLEGDEQTLEDAKAVLTKYPPAYCIPGTPIWIVNKRPLLPHPSEVISEYWDGSIKDDCHYRRNRAMKRALEKLKEETGVKKGENISNNTNKKRKTSNLKK